jgi:hypothetical protein
MGQALEIISGYASAPDTTITDITMASGDSKTIRNFSEGEARIITAWPTGHTTAGLMQIKSPRMHDNVQGFQMENPATAVIPPLMTPFLQKLVSQDTLFIGLSGSAGTGDLMLASLLIHYDNLPGADANLITPEQLNSRGLNIMSVQNSLTLATATSYSGAQVINTTDDNFKANTDYAIIGFQNTVRCGAVCYSGSDLANLRLGGPGCAGNLIDTRDWFVKISNLSGLACIPVFNSANKSNFYVEGYQDEDAAATVVTTFMVELGAGA